MKGGQLRPQQPQISPCPPLVRRHPGLMLSLTQQCQHHRPTQIDPDKRSAWLAQPTHES